LREDSDNWSTSWGKMAIPVSVRQDLVCLVVGVCRPPSFLPAVILNLILSSPISDQNSPSGSSAFGSGFQHLKNENEVCKYVKCQVAGKDSMTKHRG
jgi:hypothetical protein